MMADITLVATREVSEKLRNRGFLLFTLLMIIVLPAAVVVPGLLSGDGAGRYDVVVSGQDSGRLGQVASQRADAVGATVDTKRVTSPQAAKEAVRSGDADAAIVGGSQVYTDGDDDSALTSLLQSSAQQLRTARLLRDAGVPPDQARAALGTEPLQVVSLGEQPQRTGASLAVTMVGAVLLFVALLLYGSWVAAGVVEEKASRVIEVVLSAVRPVRLLAGKVIGIGVLALGQLAVSVAFAVAAAYLTGMTLPPVALPAIGSVLGWFVLGFAFYCCIFAVAGSLVSKQEDLQYTQMPPMLLLMGAYFVSIQVQVGALDASVAHVLAYIPPFSPIVVPMLTASGALAGWEIALAALLTLAAAVLLMRVAARLYSGSVLRFGGRVSLREAWK